MPQHEAMTEEQLHAAIDVLHWLSDAFSALPDERDKTTQAAICCTVAASYAVELLAHLANDKTLPDAIRETARGSLPIGGNE